MAKTKQKAPEREPANGNQIRIPWDVVRAYEARAAKAGAAADRIAKGAGAAVTWTSLAVAALKADTGLVDGNG